MKNIIIFLEKLGFWKYILFFTILAIIISESLIVIQSIWLTGAPFDKNLLIVGFITPAVDAFIVFTLSAFLIKYLLSVQNRLKEVQKISKIGFWEYDIRADNLYWSDEVYNIFGFKAQEFKVTYSEFLNYVHPDDREELKNKYTRSLLLKTDFHIMHRVILRDGTIRHLEENCSNYLDKHGNVIRSIGAVVDITDKVLNSEKMQKLFDLQQNIVIQTDGKILRKANRFLLDFFGFQTLEEFRKITSCICDRFIKNDDFFHLGKVPEGELWIQTVEKIPKIERVVSMEDKNHQFHAFSISLNHFEDDDYIVSFSDISDTIQEKFSLEKRVYRDTLTDAHSRDFYEHNIKSIQESISAHGKELGLMLFDIDKFKNINDTYGHNVGDMVLKTLVKIVKKSIREDDILIRWGGEEFIIILEIESIIKLEKIANFIREEIEKGSFGSVKRVTCSFGITLYKKSEEVLATIERADKALYLAKNSGRNNVKVL